MSARRRASAPMMIALAWSALACAGAIGCSVNLRSPGLACATQADCSTGRVCEQGYCVVDPASCPAVCTRCDPTTSPPTCTIDGGGGNSITCPAGMHCDIHCASPNACGSITCTTADSCTIACSTNRACHDITCGGARCAITCQGNNACNDITCSNACACDVTGCATGACGTISCPMSGATYCTASGSDNQPCLSTPTGCDSC